MSKYEEVKTNITDGPHLVAALKEMGYTATVHETPQHLFGYQDDQRKEVAHIIVNRSQIPGASNDIGFIKEADGRYQAIISQYDKHRHDSKWMGKLTQHYAEIRTMTIARAKGYQFLGKTVVEGKVKLQFAVRS